MPNPNRSKLMYQHDIIRSLLRGGRGGHGILSRRLSYHCSLLLKIKIMEVIDRKIIEYLEDLEKELVAFRGVRQIWANVAGGGALSGWRKYDLSQDERSQIVEDLRLTQVGRLSQLCMYAQRIKDRIAANKSMKRTEEGASKFVVD